MSADTMRTAPTGLDLEASRVRVRLLETFWAGSGLASRERRARLDAVLQEAVAHLDPAGRERVVEKVLEDLARWSPAADAAAGGGGGGDDLRAAVQAALTRDKPPQGDLAPEDQVLIDCLRAIVDHLSLESQHHVLLLKEVVKGQTVTLPAELPQIVRSLMKGGPASDGAKGIERLKGLLRDLQIGRNALLAGARAAAGQALARLVADLDPGKLQARAGAKKGLEEFERLYEEIAALTPEELRDRYFSEAYKREIKKATQA